MSMGHEAETLLENVLLEGALSAIILSYDKAWKDSSLLDVEGREASFRMLRACGEFKGLLTKLIRTGSLAAIQLETERMMLEQKEAETDQNERGHGADNS